mmetsp:Transcript_46494/g.83113  ORF Transcript_46494/g.83113 Transcript_46494/m.83113 type:complete len:300 (+) Transcript_46494:3863-4762(+)
MDNDAESDDGQFQGAAPPRRHARRRQRPLQGLAVCRMEVVRQHDPERHHSEHLHHGLRALWPDRPLVRHHRHGQSSIRVHLPARVHPQDRRVRLEWLHPGFVEQVRFLHRRVWDLRDDRELHLRRGHWDRHPVPRGPPGAHPARPEDEEGDPHPRADPRPLRPLPGQRRGPAVPPVLPLRPPGGQAVRRRPARGEPQPGRQLRGHAPRHAPHGPHVHGGGVELHHGRLHGAGALLQRAVCGLRRPHRPHLLRLVRAPGHVHPAEPVHRRHPGQLHGGLRGGGPRGPRCYPELLPGVGQV